jgi:hypothetical protein
MIKAFCATLFVSLFTFGYNVSFGQVHKPDSVKIEFEGFNTETFRDVSCEDFATSFLKTKKIKVIYAPSDLSRFELLKSDFKKAKNRSLDVRGTITYSYGKNSTKYCFDVFGYFYKDGQLYTNKNLLIAISDKTYTNHPKYLDTLRYR